MMLHEITHCILSNGLPRDSFSIAVKKNLAAQRLHLEVVNPATRSRFGCCTEPARAHAKKPCRRMSRSEAPTLSFEAS